MASIKSSNANASGGGLDTGGRGAGMSPSPSRLMSGNAVAARSRSMLSLLRPEGNADDVLNSEPKILLSLSKKSSMVVDSRSCDNVGTIGSDSIDNDNELVDDVVDNDDRVVGDRERCC